jgi:Zn-dependent protease with chaperone function
MSSIPIAQPVRRSRYSVMTPVEGVLFILGIGVGFLVYWAGRGLMGSLFPENLANIGWILLYLLAGLGLPSFLAPLVAMALPSWRYKTICGVIVLFILVALGVIDFFHSTQHGFLPLLGWVIRFGVRVSAGLGGFRLWRAWQETRAQRPRTAAPDAVEPNARMPRTPLALLALSLIAIPASYISILLSVFVTIGLSALLFFILSDLGRVPVVLIVAAALAPVGGAWAAIKAVRVALRPPVFQQPAHILELSRRPVLHRLVSNVCAAVGTSLPSNVILTAHPTFYVTQSRVMTLDGAVKGRTLAIGMPLLKAMSASELSSVLAHEFAHFSGRDTLYSSVAAPVDQGLRTSVQVLASSRGGSSTGVAVAFLQLPSLHFLVACAQFFSSITMLISRRHELRADWIAARCFGKEAFCSALRKSIGISSDFPEAMKTLTWGNAQALFSSYGALLEQAPGKLDQHTREALEEEESEYSSHPTLRTREGTLPAFKPSVKVPAGDLLAELAPDEARLSEAFAPIVEDYQERLAGANPQPPGEAEASSTKATRESAAQD